MKFQRCPQCTKLGVSLRQHFSERARFGCRYCAFVALADSDDANDVRKRAELEAANGRITI